MPSVTDDCRNTSIFLPAAGYRDTIPYTLTYSQLRADLMQADLDARRHKRNRRYQLDFEANLERNLDSLCQELYSRNYKPLPSECFIITDPK